eukprot:UN05844
MQFFMENAAGDTLDNIGSDIGVKDRLQEKVFFFDYEKLLIS